MRLEREVKIDNGTACLDRLEYTPRLALCSCNQ
jgi:hypothetical protein